MQRARARARVRGAGPDREHGPDPTWERVRGPGPAPRGTAARPRPGGTRCPRRPRSSSASRPTEIATLWGLLLLGLLDVDLEHAVVEVRLDAVGGDALGKGQRAGEAAEWRARPGNSRRVLLLVLGLALAGDPSGRCRRARRSRRPRSGPAGRPSGRTRSRSRPRPSPESSCAAACDARCPGSASRRSC